MSARMYAKKGFTLVEILIVVVILGILAAIVIPQFTQASESARASSLKSQLQTIRSQLELYQVQHLGAYPDLETDWTQMTELTDKAGDTVAMGAAAADVEFGPYLQKAPQNPFTVVSSDATNVGDLTSVVATNGWAYDVNTGTIKAIIEYDKGVELGLIDDDEYTAAGTTHPDFNSF
ncbi:MAG: prepilin-type N-terminal cleavage/methylation domain-containing protein [Planctomycetota bacterium]